MRSAYIFSSLMGCQSVRTRNKKDGIVTCSDNAITIYSVYGFGRYIQASMLTSDLVFHVLVLVIKEIIRISLLPQQPSKIFHSLQVTVYNNQSL